MENEKTKRGIKKTGYNLFLEMYPEIVLKKTTMVDVAKKIGVQRQTVARWKRELDDNGLCKVFKNLIKRLNEEVEKEGSRTEDIIRLSDSVVKIGAVIRKGGISLLSL